MFDKLRKCVLLAASFGAVAFGTAEASAADYVCQVQASLWNGSLGTNGFVFFTVYNGTNCTGTFVKSVYLCSAGATSTSCPSSSGSQHARDSLISHFESLQRAAAADQRINVVLATCNGGGTTCSHNVNFFSN